MKEIIDRMDFIKIKTSALQSIASSGWGCTVSMEVPPVYLADFGPESSIFQGTVSPEAGFNLWHLDNYPFNLAVPTLIF